MYCNLLPYSVAKLFIIRVVLLTPDRPLQTTPTTFSIILNFCIITITLLRLLSRQFIGGHTQLCLIQTQQIRQDYHPAKFQWGSRWVIGARYPFQDLTQ